MKQNSGIRLVVILLVLALVLGIVLGVLTGHYILYLMH